MAPDPTPELQLTAAHLRAKHLVHNALRRTLSVQELSDRYQDQVRLDLATLPPNLVLNLQLGKDLEGYFAYQPVHELGRTALSQVSFQLTEQVVLQTPERTQVLTLSCTYYRKDLRAEQLSANATQTFLLVPHLRWEQDTDEPLKLVLVGYTLCLEPGAVLPDLRTTVPFPNPLDQLQLPFNEEGPGFTMLAELAHQIPALKQFWNPPLPLASRLALVAGELCGEALSADRQGLAHQFEGLSVQDVLGLSEEELRVYYQDVQHTRELELTDGLLYLLDTLAAEHLNVLAYALLKLRYNETRPPKHGKNY